MGYENVSESMRSDKGYFPFRGDIFRRKTGVITNYTAITNDDSFSAVFCPGSGLRATRFFRAIPGDFPDDFCPARRRKVSL
jgi:hypothetical protein